MPLCGAGRNCGCAITSVAADSAEINGYYPTIDVAGGGGPLDPWVLSLNENWTAEVVDAINPTAWTGVTFSNSWVNHASNQPVQYRKVADRVTVRGTMRNGTLSAVAFTLPAGFRPPAVFTVGLSGWTGAAATLIYAAVDTSGQVTVYGSTNVEVAVEFTFSTST